MKHASSWPPVELDGARVECFVSVAALRPSGKVTVLMDAREIDAASALAICRYSGESSVYLFHCSANWAVLAAGHYASVEAAKASAEHGYHDLSGRWECRA